MLFGVTHMTCICACACVKGRECPRPWMEQREIESRKLQKLGDVGVRHSREENIYAAKAEEKEQKRSRKQAIPKW